MTYTSEPLHHLIDDLLRHLYEMNPTSATFDGVHTYDDHVEDLSRASIERQAQDLAGYARRLAAIRDNSLTPLERIERPMLKACINARIHELQVVRTWQSHPGYYGEVLATALASQTLFGYAPPSDRARRVLSKLRQVPRLLEAARANVTDPPGIFIKAGLETLRGVQKMIDRDLPKAFSDVDDLHLLGDLADASTEASDALKAHIGHLETEVAPKARASFRLGRSVLEERLRVKESIAVNCETLLSIAMRELRSTQEQFRRVASRLGTGDPVDLWRAAKQRHPGPGELVEVAQRQLDELSTFVRKRSIVSMPECEPVTVAPTPSFFRWTFASTWTPGPFETKATRAYYYITDVDPAWSDERKEEHLRDFSDGILWSISIHEVMPGHFLHYQHLRQVESTLRKSILFAPVSFVEGWAHYSEQMMIEAGFGKGNDVIKLGQLAESLIRLARTVVGIRLHAEDLSVEQGMRFFRDEAYLEEGSARREAERGTFDPAYLLYAIGKLMILKLREDCKAQEGDAFTLRSFHDRLLGNGLAPMAVHRRLLLGPESGELLE